MGDTIHKIWQDSLKEIRNELTEVSYQTWFANLEPMDFVNETLYIFIPNNNRFNQSILENRYLTLINNVLTNVRKKETKAKFIMDMAEIPDITKKERDESKFKKESSSKKTDIKSPAPSKHFISNLNNKYTFEKFVIGENNRFTHAASVAVAEFPSERYNPLFIYGGVGLGKTHLMQAIGNHINDYFREKRVVYVSCETFTNEFIDSIKNQNGEAFRNRYRNVDILLVDDIQFLAGKEGTQEEFFHTFNALHEMNKQIVITSDRPPKEIPNLAERLRSRFEMGLITDISAPNFETRIAILRKKAESYKENIPDEVLSFIADNIQSNIRELEGALTTAIAYAKLSGQNISLSNAKIALRESFSKDEKIIDADYIKEVTAKFFNITVDEINSKSRKKTISQPRQVAMYLTREMTDLSLPKIGEEFGGRDHTTIMHGCQKIIDEMENNTDFKNLVIRISNEIKKE